ncbi:hypothetical protein, partial [Streptomyces sp. NPDC005046]
LRHPARNEIPAQAEPRPGSVNTRCPVRGGNFRARAYCDAGFEAGGRFELNILLPLTTVVGGLAGLATLAIGRLLVLHAPTVVRACLPALLVVSVTVLLAWWFFAAAGTLDGYPGDSGRCPASNIPPQWPDWIPA